MGQKHIYMGRNIAGKLGREGAYRIKLRVERSGYRIDIHDSQGGYARMRADNAAFATLSMEVIDTIAPDAHGATDLARATKAWVDWIGGLNGGLAKKVA